jgi:3',5'-cyclic-AMP phosphodiesterase
MVRADPGDFFDGVGYSRLTLNAASKIENEYVMWRKDTFAETATDSGCGDNGNQVLHPRIADQEWTYIGAYK